MLKKLKLLRSLVSTAANRLRRRRDPFDRFQDSVRSSTWESHDAILDWAIRRADLDDAPSPRDCDDPLVARGWALRAATEASFRGKRSHLGQSLRVMIHVPDFGVSPGGYSLFNNMIAALNHIGVPSVPLTWSDSTLKAFEAFRPTCLMTSDHESYLGRIEWDVVRAWKENNGMLLGLTASLQEYGNTPLDGRLDWAARNHVDFYYSFQSPEYLEARSEYQAFRRNGYPILSVEFGANPTLYYPVRLPSQDLDYIFLASSNPDKHDRYFRYLARIMQKYHGFIDGPGWKNVSRFAPPKTHRYLYARAKVGLNLHIPNSIDWPSELNERTYILAACGVPQLVDSARLLPRRFSSGCFFVADSPDGYIEIFRNMLADPDGARRRASQAMEEVYAKHTTYHRMDAFLSDLEGRFNSTNA